jgi:RNA polymerase sigma-70 factor (ECF subfamily)
MAASVATMSPVQRSIHSAEEISDSTLIAAVLTGEKHVFHDLVRRYETQVYRFVYAIVRNEADAEEVVQEALLNAYRGLASFRAEARFRTWLFTIALNEARKCLRQRSARYAHSIDEDSEYVRRNIVAMIQDEREIPLEALERRELHFAIHRAILALPLIYRDVFWMRSIEGQSTKATADALAMTTDTVKIRLHRARLLLRNELVPYYVYASRGIRTRENTTRLTTQQSAHPGK